MITVARDADTTVTETALDGGDLEVTVVDDRDGRAVFTGVTTGTYRLTISPPEGYLYGSVEAVVVRANETTAVTAPLTARSLLSIAIRDAGFGAPVAGACVVVLDERAGGVVRQNPACADDQGRIRLDYYWPGRYRLFAYATDGVHGSQWVGARGGTGDLEQAAWFSLASHETTNVAVRLDRAGSISGVVTGAQAGTPVSGLCPSVTPVAPDAVTPVNVECTGEDGRYTIRGLGPYRWRVQFPDYTGAHAWVWSGGAVGRHPDRRAVHVVGFRHTADPARVRGPAGRGAQFRH